jgi:hypothetical protein
MYGGITLDSAIIPEVGSKPLLWAATAAVVVTVVGVLAVVRVCSKVRRARAGG